MCRKEGELNAKYDGGGVEKIFYGGVTGQSTSLTTQW